MQNESGLKKLLRFSACYQWFQKAIGSAHANQWLLQQVYRPQSGDKVVDFGCGPGVMCGFLPDGVEYVGIDLNATYIGTASKLYGQTASFVAGRLLDFAADPRFHRVDLFMCNAVLHHLDDGEVVDVLQFARTHLKQGGRFVSFEPCFLRHQGRVSRWLMRQDRGQNIRAEEEWKAITGRVFEKQRTDILTGIYRIPWVAIVIECENGGRL